MLFNRTSILFCCLAGLFYSGVSHALSSDKDAPLELEADSADINQKTGITTYLGTVKITQGSMVLTADKVVIEYRNNKAHSFTATGEPANFKQMPDDSDTPVKGKGRTILYLINSEELVLIDNAELQQAGDSFTSDRIVYDRVAARLKAGAVAEGSQRVHVTIQPEKLK